MTSNHSPRQRSPPLFGTLVRRCPIPVSFLNVCKPAERATLWTCRYTRPTTRRASKPNGRAVPTTTTLSDIVEASNIPPARVIDAVLERVTTDQERTDFVHGLSERILAHSVDRSDAGRFEIDRWIGSWLLSLELAADARFQTADREATGLADAGKLDDGFAVSSLRQRYNR